MYLSSPVLESLEMSQQMTVTSLRAAGNDSPALGALLGGGRGELSLFEVLSLPQRGWGFSSSSCSIASFNSDHFYCDSCLCLLSH